MKRIYLLMFALLLIIFIPQCGDDGISSNRKIIFPDSNVSYQDHVEPFMLTKCAYQGCHSSQDRKGERDMSTYFSLFYTENAGLVILFKPEESRLIQILRGNPQHQGIYNFPEGYFTENHINGMALWIKEGAKFN